MSDPLKQEIVFIDDQRHATKYFVRALQDEGYVVTALTSTDQAWEFFSIPRPGVCAIVLDIMMPPGKYLENENTKEGLRTGIFLYKRIIEVRSLRPEPLPVAVLTNVDKDDILEELETIHEEEAPQEKFKIWPKSKVSPITFAKHLHEWLGC